MTRSIIRRGPRHVTGIFKKPEKEKEKKDLRKERHYGGNSGKSAVR